MINQIEPSFGEEERKAVNKYMKSVESGECWLTEHAQTRKFEVNIAKYLHVKHCSVVANGTVAISLALYACGIKPGDEIIVPAYTFIASATACEPLGAKVVFCDVEKDTLCMDYGEFKSKVTPKTKAVILVSMNARYPSRIKEIIRFCRIAGIKVIEDAAQALGSKAHGKYLGTFGDIGCFSFSMPKIISTGQGGACVTNNTELWEKMKKIRNFGRDTGNSDNFVMKGWNFKTTDIQSVIGMEQLKKLNVRIKKKKHIAALYTKLLKGVKHVKATIPYIYTIPIGKETAICSYDILVRDYIERNSLMIHLKMDGIGTRPFYPPLHSCPAYGQNGKFPVTEEICDRGLWLPSSLNLTDDQIKYIVSKIKEYYDRVE